MPKLTVARPDQIRFVLGHSHALWGAGLSLEDYREMWEDLRRTPWGERWFTYQVLSGEDGAVLSSLKLYRPEIRIGRRRSRVCAIGAVFTPPAERGRGYAAELIRLVVAESRARGDTPALLFSDIGTAYYEALGFRRFPADEALGTLSGALPSPDEGLTLRPMREDDVPEVVETHRAWCEGRPVALLRDADHWRFILRRAETYFARLDGSDLAGRFRIAVRRGRFAGYLVAVDGADEWSVREAGAVEGDPGTLASILRRGAFEARERGMRRVHGWLPAGYEALVPEWRLRREPRRAATPMALPLDEHTGPELFASPDEVFFPYLDQF